ncbi:hypothetical protein H5410_004707 [Solanum commersonii]|uniref:Uncharacterized protein n=1 Tax=Solanum commersonii TaxID=4109 RepID=A0A9J6A4L9_SOLCO|nr:hypothetical protein H5410_004707 [Solanum commersonii]
MQQQQFQNGGSPFQASSPVPPRKPPKMFKEKEGLFLWICNFAPRKKIGMMLLCVESADLVCEDTQKLIMFMERGVFPPDTGKIRHIDSSEKNNVGQIASIESPPPPPLAYFKGYTLPPGNPCESFTLPLPPADQTRTGPILCYLPVKQAIALKPDAPSFSPRVSRLAYTHEENLSKSEFEVQNLVGILH